MNALEKLRAYEALRKGFTTEVAERGGIGGVKTWGNFAAVLSASKGSDTIEFKGKTYGLEVVDGEGEDGAKMLQISIVTDEEAGTAEVIDIMPMDTEMADEYGDEDKKFEDEEDEEKDSKSVTTLKKWSKTAFVDVGGSKTIERTGRMTRRKSYNQKAAHLGRYHPMKNQAGVAFSDYELGEGLGAWIRQSACQKHGFSTEHDRNDLAILENFGITKDALRHKAHNTLQTSLGGAFVPDVFEPEVIENLNSHGAARQAAGVIAMKSGSEQRPRISNDVTIYEPGENNAITESTMTTGLVRIDASAQLGLSAISLELDSDSVIDMASAWTRSYARAQGEYEDQGYFLSQHGKSGIDTQLDANSEYDLALTAAWSEITVSDLQEWIGKVPTWARRNMKISCSPQFYEAVLLNFSASAGGTDGDGIIRGYRLDQPTYMGIPVVLNNVAPTGYVGDQYVAWVGSFEDATKFGEVAGSQEITTDTGGDAFTKYQLRIRGATRSGFAVHDVGGTNSGIIGLKD